MQDDLRGQEPTYKEKPGAVIVGAGWVGGELARRLSGMWDIVLVDTNPSALSNPGLPPETVRFQGDGTSALVLNRATGGKASAIIATTSDDEVNLEAVRVGISLGIPRAVVLLRKPENADRAREIGVEPVLASAQLASAVESRLQEGLRFCAEIGLGQGEIAEARVLPGSTSIGMSLKDLAPGKWLVAAVYRKDRLIIPHGDTVLEEGDRVLVVGEPEVIPLAVELVRTGLPRFPRRYGARVMAVLTSHYYEKYLEEILYLAASSQVEDVDFFQARQGIPTLVENVKKGDYGILAFPPTRLGFLNRLGKRHVYQDLLDDPKIPLLVPRGSFPYRKILLPVSDSAEDKGTVEAAVDAARTLGAEITVAAAMPPALIGGKREREKMEKALRAALELAGLYRVNTAEAVLSGNPIRSMERLARDHDLIIVSRRAGKKNSLLSPDVALYLATCSPVSVLVIPR